METTSRRWNGIRLTGLAAAAALGLSACGGSADSAGDDVQVGLVANLSGHAVTTFGQPFANGFELAIEEAEAAGVLEEAGIGIEVITEDAQSETAGAVTAFNAVTGGGTPIVVHDSQSPLGQAMAPLANDQGTVLLTGAGSELENEEGYAFRFTDLVTTTESVGQYLSEGGNERVGAIVATDNPSFDALATATESSLPEGLTVVEEISSDDTNFASVLENMRSQDLDAIVLSVLPEQVGNILIQMEQQGGFEDIQSIGTLATSAEAHAVAGDAAEDLIFPQAWAPGDQGSSEFESDYEEKYSSIPTAYSGLGYQTGWITVASLIEASGGEGEITGEAVRDAVPEASQSALVEENGILDLTLTPEGASVTNGTMAEFDEDGNIISFDG